METFKKGDIVRIHAITKETLEYQRKYLSGKTLREIEEYYCIGFVKHTEGESKYEVMLKPRSIGFDAIQDENQFYGSLAVFSVRDGMVLFDQETDTESMCKWGTDTAEIMKSYVQ